MVPQEGLEPPHPCEYQILSLARLPVPPLGLRMWLSSADKSASKGRTQVPASAIEPSRGWDGSKDSLQSKGRRLRTGARVSQCPKSAKTRPMLLERVPRYADYPSFPHRPGRERAARVKRTIETAAASGLPRRPNGHRYCRQAAAMPRLAGRPATRLNGYGRFGNKRTIGSRS